MAINAVPPFKGRCLCGEVTFEIDAEPIVYVGVLKFEISLIIPQFQRQLLPLSQLQAVHWYCFHHQRCLLSTGVLIDRLL